MTKNELLLNSLSKLWVDSSITSGEGFDALFPLTKRIKIPTKTGNAVFKEISIFLKSLYQIIVKKVSTTASSDIPKVARLRGQIANF